MSLISKIPKTTPTTINSKSSLAGFWVILKKEVLDNLRDRRTLTTMAVSIIIAPLLLIGLLWFTEKTINEETDLVTADAFELPVIGAEYAPALMDWLRQNNIEIVEVVAASSNPVNATTATTPVNSINSANSPTELDVEASIKEGKHRVVIVINQEFADNFSEGKTAPIKLIHDSSISGLEQIGKQLVQRAIYSYGQQMAGLRLQVRGIDPQIIRPIHINLSDVATAESRNGNMLTMLPYLIIIFIMVGGMYLAIDTTAGEREKGSLEPLLTLPVTRKSILLAKLFATCVFSSITFALVLIGLALAMTYAPVEMINFQIDLFKLFYIFISCLPFVFLASALLILVASFTKSYKEAQSYLSFIMMLPSLPLIFLSILSPEASLSNMMVPSLSQALIMLETFKGEMIPIHLVLVSMTSSLVLGVILSAIAVKLYEREGVLG